MKTRSIKSALIMLIATTLFWGCPYLESVEQPALAETNSSFVTTLTISFEDDDSQSYSGVGNLAIQIPLGWTIGEVVPYAGCSEGFFLFDSFITDSVNVLYPADPGYFWWGGTVSDTVFCAELTPIEITPTIFTDDTSGPFSLIYRVGDNPGFLYLSDTLNIDVSPDFTPLSGDVYVSPAGEWGATGTQIDPIKTIYEANIRLVTDSTNPGIIHLENGTYSQSVTGEMFPVDIANHTSLMGETSAGVVLDGEGLYQLLIVNQVGQTTISNLTLTNGVGYYGGAIHCVNSNLQLSNVSITESNADFGGGISCDSSFVALNNVTMSGNMGYGLYCNVSSDVTINNSILAGNSPKEIRLLNSTASITYSNVACGSDGIFATPAENLFWGVGNIEGSPQFCDVYLPSFSLAETSPCLTASDIGEYVGALEEPGCGSPVNYPPELIIFVPPFYPGLTMIEDDTLQIAYDCTDPNSDDISFDVSIDSSMGSLTFTETDIIFVPTPNWYGICPVTIYATDGMAWDTTSTSIEVLSVNDLPTQPLGIFPTDLDTVSILALADSLLTFNWHPGIDVETEELTYHLEWGITDPFQLIPSTAITTDTSMIINVLENAPNQSLSLFGITWSVYADDGEEDSPIYTATFYIDQSPVAVDENTPVPRVFELHQNYPNPFNSRTTIGYALPQQADVQIIVYDLRGHEVATLVSENQSAGYKSIQWNGLDNQGYQVSTGMYLYVITAGEFRENRKMILLK